MSKRLEGKNAVVTGSNRGLGHAIVKKFAAEGANVWAHARAPRPEFAAGMAAMAAEHQVRIVPVYFELTDSEAMKKAVQTIVQTKEPVDILVNNAGVAHGGFFQMTSVQAIRDVFEVNFFAMLELTQLVARLMVRRGQGCIVNVASISGLNLEAGNCAYGVSKAAVIAATQTLAAEYAPLGIRINAVAPGLADTDMARQMESKAGRDMIERSLLKRLAKPEEIAAAVAFLASEEASFVVGQCLRVDGGSRHG